MKVSRFRFVNLLLPLTAAALLFSVACDSAATTAPESPKASASVAGEATSPADVSSPQWSPSTIEKKKFSEKKRGKVFESGDGKAKSIGDVKFRPWSHVTIDSMRSQMKRGHDPGSQTKRVTARKGGEVGGKTTFGNVVKIPPGAIIQKMQKITVRATCMDNKNPCAAEVEFLPSQTFLLEVEITLSYEALGYEGDPYALEIYWLQEDGTGGIVTEFTVDEENGTVSFYVNHFTRYGWAY